jgi:hypothetical protein
VLAAWAWFAVIFLLNLVSAATPHGLTFPEPRLISMAGAVVITAVAGYSLWLLVVQPEARTQRIHL